MVRGTVMEPVPVTGLAANFSPMPRIAPPPLGSMIDGVWLKPAGPVALFLLVVLSGLWPLCRTSELSRIYPSFYRPMLVIGEGIPLAII
jgi:hypothetical protein